MIRKLYSQDDYQGDVGVFECEGYNLMIRGLGEDDEVMDDGKEKDEEEI